MSEEMATDGGTPPESPLVGYYEGRVSVNTLTGAIRKEGVAVAPPPVMQSLLDRLGELDADLSKTWALAKTQMRSEPSRVLADWVNLVLRRLRDDLGDGTSARNAIGDVLPELLPPKGKVTKRSLHLVKLLALDLHWRRGLTGRDLAAALAEHFVGRRESTETLEREAVAAILKSGGAPALRTYARMLGWTARLSVEQTSEIAQLRGQLDSARSRNAELSTLNGTLRSELHVLEEQNREAGERVRELEQQLQDCGNHASLQLHELTGQVVGRLTGRAEPLLTQADDALALREPSIRAAREFIQLVRAELQGIRQWLDAESTSGQPTA